MAISQFRDGGAAVELATRIGDDDDDDEAQAESLIGRRIDRFRLVRLLGQGGMAAVFLGEREDADFTQQVAIKLLRRGLYSELEQRLFRRERQALAMLSHPNIAHLLDGGVTEADSVPRNGLHRRVADHDLKPSNILVDTEGEAKLLDFGIAKLLDEDDGATRSGLAALTPDYAAPEQYGGAQISTATDVYALGVVLHELLIGARPERGATKRPSYAEGGAARRSRQHHSEGAGRGAGSPVRVGRRIRGGYRAIPPGPADRGAPAVVVVSHAQARAAGTGPA